MSKKSFSKLAILLASAFIISCNNAENTGTNETGKPAFDLASAKREIEAVNKDFMDLVAKGDTIGIANLYTTDAKVMFDGAPAALGKRSIQTVFSQILNSGVTTVDLKTIDVFGTESLLAEEGAITVYVKDMVVAVEKSIVLWKKEDGKWKLFRDIANSNSPAK